MNFENTWSIHHNHSDVVYVYLHLFCDPLFILAYWIIVLPLMYFVLTLFLRNDMIKMAHFIKKKWFLAKKYNVRTIAFPLILRLIT